MNSEALKSTETPLSWSKPLNVPFEQHVNLSETLASIQRGIDQAARGEGTYLETKDLPTDDDD